MPVKQVHSPAPSFPNPVQTPASPSLYINAKDRLNSPFRGLPNLSFYCAAFYSSFLFPVCRRASLVGGKTVAGEIPPDFAQFLLREWCDRGVFQQVQILLQLAEAAEAQDYRGNPRLRPKPLER